MKFNRKMGMNPSFSKGISKYFGGLKAVDNVSLTIENGELRCLIGPLELGKVPYSD